jgi:hypothetical protein
LGGEIITVLYFDCFKPEGSNYPAGYFRGFILSIRENASSSSSALQPGVGFGFPSFLEGFVTMVVLQGGVVNPTPNPQLLGRILGYLK